MNAEAVPPPVSLDPSLMRDAYERVRPELEAVQEDDLTHINIDIPTAVTTALGCLREVRKLQAAFEAELKSFDPKLIDKLASYTLALGHAHTLYTTAARPSEELVAIVEQATALRETLHSDALALANRGLLDATSLREVKTVAGYRALGFDLNRLSAVVRAQWARLEGKTAIQLDELTMAEQLASRILNAVGNREQAPATTADVALARQRAFTLFARTYDLLRRNVVHARWEAGDADEYMPSLYAGRARKRAPDVSPEPTTTDPAQPGRPPPAATPLLNPTASSSPIGLPGSDPFAQS